MSRGRQALLLAVVADLPSTRRKLMAAWKRMPVAAKRAILRAVIPAYRAARANPMAARCDGLACHPV